MCISFPFNFSCLFGNVSTLGESCALCVGALSHQTIQRHNNVGSSRHQLAYSENISIFCFVSKDATLLTALYPA